MLLDAADSTHVCVIPVSRAETFADGYELRFHEALYYMLIEVLGRPRLPVETVQGYVIASCLVLIVVVVIPYQMVQLFESLKQQSLYRRSNYSPQGRGDSHVIVTGHVTAASIIEFSADFFHEDVGDHEVHVATRRTPSHTLSALLSPSLPFSALL